MNPPRWRLGQPPQCLEAVSAIEGFFLIGALAEVDGDGLGIGEIGIEEALLRFASPDLFGLQDAELGDDFALGGFVHLLVTIDAVEFAREVVVEQSVREAEGNGFVLYLFFEIDAAEDVPGRVQEDVEELELERGFRTDLGNEADFEV